MFDRLLTNDELDQLVNQALSQLAVAVQEFEVAQRASRLNSPNEELSRKRLELARESLQLCLRTFLTNLNARQSPK